MSAESQDLGGSRAAVELRSYEYIVLRYVVRALIVLPAVGSWVFAVMLANGWAS